MTTNLQSKVYFMAVSTASEFETPITFQMDVIAKPLNDQKQRCKLCYIVFAQTCP